MKVLGPEFRTHVNTRQGWWHPCNPRSLEAEAGGHWSQIASQISLSSELWVQLRDPISIQKVRAIEEDS